MRYADSHEIIIEKEPFHTAYTHNKEEQINNESEYRIADISKQKAMPVIVTRHTKHSIITRGILKSSSSLVCKNILTAFGACNVSDIENLLPVIIRPTIVLAAIYLPYI